MRRMGSKIALSMVLVGGSLGVTSPAGAQAACVGTTNTAGACVEVNVTTSEKTYEDCVYLIDPSTCTPVTVPVPVPHVSGSCSGWVSPTDQRFYCVRN